ncbi:hypothetical protein ACTXT7_010118 [Hymenolepis weldensis]
MFTQQLKFSEHPLDQLRPSSGRSYPRSRIPDSSKGSRVVLKKVAWVIGELLDTEMAYLDSLRDIKESFASFNKCFLSNVNRNHLSSFVKVMVNPHNLSPRFCENADLAIVTSIL